MEIRRTGDMLRGIYGGNDESDIDTMLVTDSSTYPQLRSNAIGMRVDVYGEVLSFTKEYEQGWRIYDLYGCMYKQDGTGRDQLHNLIGSFRDEKVAKPVSNYVWVHPNHLQIESLFPLIQPGHSRLKSGTRYLNRMGFVVLLEGAITDITQPMLRDAHGNLYYTTGRRSSEHESMTDLVREIEDWDNFKETDWSEVDLTKRNAKASLPEHYDPADSSQKELLGQFYDTLAKAHGLAKRIGATFTFTMDTTSSR